jgi:glycosyltransferase involved in cell wall biosynthesis
MMVTHPFVSVIVPTHNRLSLLKQTLAYLDRQTYPSHDYEIIVVDDGSDDGTTDYLHQLSLKKELRYLTQEQKGPAAARNAGVHIAKGEVIAFTDDDCLPEPNWLAALTESYRKSPDQLVAVGGRINNRREGHWLQLFYAVQNRHFENKAERPAYLDTANASFRRATFLELGGFNENIPFASGEDIDFGFRLTAAGYTLQLNEKAVVWHIGRTSLRGLVKQSFIRGKGDAILRITYPEFFAGPPSSGVRLQVKRILNSMLRFACNVPVIVQPLSCGLIASLRCIAFTIPEIEFFIGTQFPKQVHHYRGLDLPWSRLYLYLLLEWLDYLLRLLGRFVGTYKEIYTRVRDGHPIL